MASASTLPAPAQAASRAALNAAFADQQASEPVKADVDSGTEPNGNGESADLLEPGEIQEVDMQAQADGIRTVFSDPTNFNVKVCLRSCQIFLTQSNVINLAPSVFLVDSLV
jgi:translation initiation factor 4E